jgi:hypothetical protein
MSGNATCFEHWVCGCRRDHVDFGAVATENYAKGSFVNQ